MYVKLNPDKHTEDGKQIQVFDPVKKKFLPEEGADVPDNVYWTRRLSAGDVVKATPGTDREEGQAAPGATPLSPKKTAAVKGKTTKKATGREE